MDYYRLNQIAMAVLGALLLFFGTKTIVNIAFQEHKPEVAEQKPEEKKPAGGGGEAELATLLASANEAHGADVAKKCSICHNFDKGGANMIGPNLYGVLGRPIASHEGYEYSDALKAKAKELGNWDYAKINSMITNPGAFVPGTKMALFPGLPDAKERADVLLFLRNKNDNPPPLPQAPAGGAPTAGAEQKPAEGGKPAAATGGGAEIDKLLASADPKQGEADAALCKVCHTFDKGGAVVVGPNLYGVVGRKIASVEGFNYTPALKAHEGNWTYELIDTWITNPQAFAPGTMMAFPGIPDAKKRANVIAFLRSKNDNPPPLPQAPGGAPEKKPEEAPAAETPPPATPAPAAPAPAPSAETPAPAAPAPAPSPAPSPSAETPAPAPTPSAPAPSAETPTPSAPAPSAETPPPAPAPAQSAETPSPAPAAPAPAPSAETPAPSAETHAPSAETPPPAAETPPPSPAPSAETPQPPAESPAPSAETPQPSAETPAPSAETPAPSEETGKSEGEGPFPSQPQPVYPEGPTPGQ
ncbi:MAG TPA: c-type cytochrome [Methyloceanibacter sp.]|nr:c-type cytochrome [Methyloceanibacter sp.]